MDKLKISETKIVEKEKVIAEKFNDRFAMLGLVAAIGAYLSTGKITPSFCKNGFYF